MEKTQEIETKKNNDLIIKDRISFKNDRLKVTNLMEKPSMDKDSYSKTEIDLKLDKIQSTLKHGFEKIDTKFEILGQNIELKFDTFEQKIENILLTQENKRLEEQAKNRKEFMFWAIGILVTLAAIAIPIWFNN